MSHRRRPFLGPVQATDCRFLPERPGALASDLHSAGFHRALRMGVTNEERPWMGD